MITLMKIGPYDPIIAGLSKYESLKLLTLGLNDPPVDIKRAEEMMNSLRHDLAMYDIVLSSELKRAETSVAFLQKRFKKNVVILKHDYLNEIRFDMESFCDASAYELGGSNLVRKRFVEAFVSDKLAESRQEIKARISKLDSEINRFGRANKNVLIVSHTFLLKLFLVYLDQRDLFERPEMLFKHLNPNQRIMEFFRIIPLQSVTR